jgi:hypothetical protein
MNCVNESGHRTLSLTTGDHLGGVVLAIYRHSTELERNFLIWNVEEQNIMRNMMD